MNKKHALTSLINQYVYAKIGSFEVSIINKYRTHVRDQYKESKDDLDNKFKGISKNEFQSEFDYDMYMESFVDDNFILGEIVKLSDQLSIVALYRIVELKTKMILRHIYSKEEVRKFYRIDILKNRLKKDFNVELEGISNFDYIDELRCINNAIKHKNKVTQELAKFDGWNVGDDLKNLSSSFDRISKYVPKYLSDLVEQINSNISSGIISGG